MNKRLIHLLILPLCLLAGVAPADPLPQEIAFAPLPDPAEVLARSDRVTTNRYPDADSVRLEEWAREAYRPDGTSVAVYDEYRKILTEKGRRAGSIQTFYYAAAYGTVSVLRAEIRKPDGRCEPVDVNRNGRVMIDPGQMGANIYDPNNKVFQLSIPGLEIGDVLHVTALQRTHKARVPDTWADLTQLEGSEPILRLNYEVVSPAERPLRHVILRDPAGATVTALTNALSDGRTLRRWTAVDVPRIFPEPEMPAAHTVVQRVLLSTAPDWPSISRWYWTLCQPRLSAVTPEMRATVSNRVSGISYRDAQIRSIFKFVSQEIRYMGITTEDVAPGYEPHDVSMTFSNRYGVCRDKAALLVALLRLAGFEAYLVLINVGSKIDPENPLPFFNHAIVAVAKPEGGYLLMDPTNENTRDLFPAYLCNRSYLVAHPQGESLRVSEVDPATHNLVRIATRGTLDDAGVLALDIRLAFDGINDTTYRGRFLSQKPDERRRWFEGLLKARLPGAELTAFRITPEVLMDTAEPLTVALSCRARDYPVQGEGLVLCNLPWLGNSVGFVNYLLDGAGLVKRKYPYVTELACGVEETIEIDTGRAVGAPVQMPPPVSIDKSGVRFERTCSASNRTLRAQSRFLLTQPEFTPAEYADLKDSLRAIEQAARHRPLFAAPPAAAQADARVLSDDLRVELASPTAWTSTRVIVRQVLTYAGKKRFAELKMPYNPVWQTAELVSATVSNVDGSVHVVAGREINVMDAPWVGGASRYPAGRLLVASLPGIEVGSVIRTTVRRTQRDAPFFSLGHNFGGFEPTDAGSLEVVLPRNLNLKVAACHAEALRARCVTNDAWVAYRWDAGAIPAVRPEDSLPPWSVYRPTVFVSVGNFKRYARELDRAFEAAMRGDSALRDRARRLTRGIRDPRARIAAIRDDVARSIREAGPSFQDLPIRSLTPAERTLADGYGHDADRAILLAALLRAAGFEADPILVSASPRALPQLIDPARLAPQLNLYSDVLVRVANEKESFYLNDTDQYAALGATPHDRHPFLDLDGHAGRIVVAEEHRDRSRAETLLDLEANGRATITLTHWFYGASFGPFRSEYEEMQPEDRRRHFQNLVAGISQSATNLGTLVTATDVYPGFRSFTVRADSYAARDGRQLTLLLPDEAPFLALRSDRRTNPLLVDNPSRTEWTCRVILPPGVRSIPMLPPAVDWALPDGLGHVRVDVERSARPDGRIEITLRRTVSIEPAIVPAEIYPALLEIHRRLMHPQMRTVLVELE